MKGRLSEGPHEIQGCCSQKCSGDGVGWVMKSTWWGGVGWVVIKSTWWGGMGHEIHIHSGVGHEIHTMVGGVGWSGSWNPHLWWGGGGSWNPHHGWGGVGYSGVSGWDNRCYSYLSLMKNDANCCDMSLFKVFFGWSEVVWVIRAPIIALSVDGCHC